MYRNLDECLSQVYKISSVMIEPRGNTASVINHIQGDCPSSSGFTQAEWHANAAMIRSQVSGCLDRPLLVAVVECQYGKLDGLLIIAGALVAEKVCDDVYLAADILRHIYSEMPKRVAIMDKYETVCASIWRLGNRKRDLSYKCALKSEKSLIKCEFLSIILLYFGESCV